MQIQTTRRRPAGDGFTLIELLLVLAILVVLFGMATAIFSGTRKGALIDAAKGEIGIIENSIDRYEWDMKAYPSNLEDLAKKPSGDNAEDWRGPYMKENEDFKDPWGSPYKIAAPGKNNSDTYDLWSLGPDKQDGTDDDIGNW